MSIDHDQSPDKQTGNSAAAEGSESPEEGEAAEAAAADAVVDGSTSSDDGQ